MTDTPPNQSATPQGPSSTQMAALAHLSALLGALVGIPPLGPLLMWLIKKDDAYVTRESLEALNFNLSWLLYIVVIGTLAFVGTFIVIGVVLYPVLLVQAIAWFVLILVGGSRASSGQGFRYPLTIRFIR